MSRSFATGTNNNGEIREFFAWLHGLKEFTLRSYVRTPYRPNQAKVLIKLFQKFGPPAGTTEFFFLLQNVLKKFTMMFLGRQLNPGLILKTR